MKAANILAGPCLLFSAIPVASWAAGEVVFESLSPGGAQPEWMKDLNALSETERKSRVRNYRVPESVKPARVAAGVMKREESSPQLPVRSPVVAPESPDGERPQVRPVPLSDLQLPAPAKRTASQRPVPISEDLVPASAAAEKRKSGVSARSQAPVQEQVAPREEAEPAQRASERVVRAEQEGEEARRARWRGVFRKPAPEPDALVAAAPPQKPKQAPPSPSRSEKKASKEESKASKVAKADKPPEPAETRGGRYQVRLSGPSRKVDLPVDEKTPEPSKSQQDEAAALDAADYDGRRDSGGSRRLFGKRSSKEDEETAAGDESKPRRGLFRGRKGDGDLVAGGRGVIETTLFGD